MMNTTSTHLHVSRTLAIAGAAVVLAAGLSGCRDERSESPPHQFLPDMDDSPKFKPQAETEFYADGRSMRPSVKGAVAFGDRLGQSERERANFLKESPETFRGIDSKQPANADGTPQYVKFMPASVVNDYIETHPGADGKPIASEAALKSIIERGQERFNIYCSVCHGLQGEGGDPANFAGGIVGRRWSYPVPSYHDPKYKDRSQKTGQDGYIFSTILHGVPDVDPAKPLKMPSYADKVNESDAWAIVTYVRTLQAAWVDNTPPAPATPAKKATQANPAGETPPVAAKNVEVKP